MRRNLSVVLILGLAVGILCQRAYGASVAAPSVSNSEALQAAKALTKITGIAISPLLGVSAVGAYDYLTCPEGQHAKLPWYAQVKFWLPALLIVGLCAAKDAGGIVIPSALKKPFDALEATENKVSGLVAAGAVVPSIATIFHSQLAAHAAAHGHILMAGMDLTPLLNILTIPLALVCFVAVWMVGHMVHVLILISPFGAVDAALKSMRTSVMAGLVMVNALDPRLAALISLGIVIFALLIAGWSFRLTFFGEVYIWDFVTFRAARFHPKPNGNWMFSARRMEKTPIRSFGKLVTGADGKLTFEYRPWLVLPRKTLAVPADNLAVGRGLLYPEVMREEGPDAKKAIFLLPPRYKGHEDELARAYGITKVRDVGILKGLKAVWHWITGQGTARPLMT